MLDNMSKNMNGNDNENNNENNENNSNENNDSNNNENVEENENDGNENKDEDVNMTGNINPNEIEEDNRLRKERPAEAPNISTYTFQHKLNANVKPLTMAELNKVNDEHQRKQLIGERLFPKIHQKEPTKAGRLTSMILTLEIKQIFPLLDDDEKLSEMIKNTLEIMHERDQRDKNSSSVTQTNVTERVNQMRQQHEQTVANLLSPNSGSGNGDGNELEL